MASDSVAEVREALKCSKIEILNVLEEDSANEPGDGGHLDAQASLKIEKEFGALIEVQLELFGGVIKYDMRELLDGVGQDGHHGSGHD